MLWYNVMLLGARPGEDTKLKVYKDTIPELSSLIPCTLLTVSGIASNSSPIEKRLLEAQPESFISDLELYT